MKFFALITAIFSLLCAQNVPEFEISGESRVLGGHSQAALVIGDASDHHQGVKVGSNPFTITPNDFAARLVAVSLTSFFFAHTTGRLRLLGAFTARGPPVHT